MVHFKKILATKSPLLVSFFETYSYRTRLLSVRPWKFFEILIASCILCNLIFFTNKFVHGFD